MITPPTPTPPIPPAPPSFDALLPRSSSRPGTKPIPAEFGHTTTTRSLHLFCLWSFLVRLIKSFTESLAAATAAYLSLSLSLSTICRLSRFFAALLPRLQFFIARARARAGLLPDALCLTLPGPTSYPVWKGENFKPMWEGHTCQLVWKQNTSQPVWKGRKYYVYLNDTRLNLCEKDRRLESRVSTGVKRMRKRTNKKIIRESCLAPFCLVLKTISRSQKIDPGLKLGIRDVYLDSWHFVRSRGVWGSLKKKRPVGWTKFQVPWSDPGLKHVIRGVHLDSW